MSLRFMWCRIVSVHIFLCIWCFLCLRWVYKYSEWIRSTFIQETNIILHDNLNCSFSFVTHTLFLFKPRRQQLSCFLLKAKKSPIFHPHSTWFVQRGSQISIWVVSSYTLKDYCHMSLYFCIALTAIQVNKNLHDRGIMEPRCLKCMLSILPQSNNCRLSHTWRELC